jgi:hypothetical protein
VAPAAVATLIVLSVELLEIIIISLTEFGISLITCAIAFLHYKQE